MLGSFFFQLKGSVSLVFYYFLKENFYQSDERGREFKKSSGRRETQNKKLKASCWRRTDGVRQGQRGEGEHLNFYRYL